MNANSSLKCIFRNIKTFDIFGTNLAFTYNNSPKHKTLFGSFLSLFLVSLFIYKFSLSLKDLILKENLEFRYEESPVRNNHLELKNLEMVMCPVYSYVTGDTLFNKHYKMSAYLLDEYDSGRVHQNYTLTTSTCKNVTREIIKESSDLCFCLKFDEKEYFKLTKNKTFLQDIMMKIELEMNLEFTEKEEIDKYLNNALEIKDMLIFFPKNYINASDYYNSIRTEDDYRQVSFFNGAQSNLFIEINKLQVDLVNDIYSLGVTQPKIDSLFSYDFVIGSTSRENKIFANNKAKTDIYIRHSGKLKKYSIFSFSIENVLAKFGGYFEVFYIVFRLISAFINNSSHDTYIVKKFERKLKNIPKLINSLETFLQDFKHMEEELIISDNSRIPKENTNNNINSVDKSVSSFSNKNSINSNEMFSYQNVNIEMIKKNSNLSTNINKFIKTNLNENLTETFVNDFKSLLDYDKYYELVKEIKLMKYFLFKFEDLKWIKMFENIPFNIEKFEKFISNAEINKYTYENDNNFYFKLVNLKYFLMNNNNMNNK